MSKDTFDAMMVNITAVFVTLLGLMGNGVPPLFATIAGIGVGFAGVYFINRYVK